MYSIRVTSLCFVAALVTAPLPAQAQGASSNLTTRVAALEGRVAKLESGQVTAKDLVGTYAGIVLQLELNGPAASIRNQSATATITLNADFSAVISGTDRFCELSQSQVNAFSWSRVCPPAQTASNVAGTWSLDPVEGLVVQINGQDVINDPNIIGHGGRVIISAGTSGSGHTVFQVLIRLPN